MQRKPRHAIGRRPGGCTEAAPCIDNRAVSAGAGTRRLVPWLLFALVAAAAQCTAAREAETGRSDPAATREELGRVLDGLVATQGPHGGWPAHREHPAAPPVAFTMVVRVAGRVLAPLGLAHWDLVLVRSPGTPLAGHVLLEGWRLAGEARWLAAARRAADLLVAIQRPSGGWHSEVPVEGDGLAWWFHPVQRVHLDDDVTPGATRFLLSLWRVTREPRYREAAERGLALLLEMQLPSGAWPPVRRPPWLRAVRVSREDRPSLNDGTTALVIETLLEAWRGLGRPELLAAAERGGEWLLAAQQAAPHPGWAQQYDDAGRPAGMRRFEPPALATWETRHAADALAALAEATGEARWCGAVRAAAAWLATVALGPDCWPRFVEPGGGHPLFLDADGRTVRPEAARPGYDWIGDFGIPFLLWRVGLRDGAPPPVRAAGDPGACPGSPGPLHAAGGPRALAAEAAALVARIEPPSRSVCAPARTSG